MGHVLYATYSQHLLTPEAHEVCQRSVSRRQAEDRVAYQAQAELAKAEAKATRLKAQLSDPPHERRVP